MFPTEPIERDPRRRKENRYGRDEYQAFRAGMRAFIEEYPLYKRIKLDPPPYTKHFTVEEWADESGTGLRFVRFFNNTVRAAHDSIKPGA